MSDYLNNLAAKNLNPTEEVRPRPISPFEQLPAAGGSGFGQYSGLEMIGSEPVPGETGLDTPSLPRRTLADLLMTLPVPNQETYPGNEQQPEELSAISEAHSKRSHDYLSPPGILRASQPVERLSSEQLAGAKVGSSSDDSRLQRKQATKQQSIMLSAVDSQPVKTRDVQPPQIPEPDFEHLSSSLVIESPIQPKTSRKSAGNQPQKPVVELPEPPLIGIKTEQQRSDELSITPKQHSEELTKTQTTNPSMLEKSRKTRVSQSLAESTFQQQKQVRDQRTLPSQVVIPQPKKIFSPDIPGTRPGSAFTPLIRETMTEQIIPAGKPPSVKAKNTETDAISKPELKTQTASKQESPRPEPSLTPETSGKIAARPHVRKYVEPPMPPLVKLKGTPEESTPTIQVTIGRVEVRAMPPQAPSSKKQRSKPPVMSLDEYLRQRAKGGSS